MENASKALIIAGAILLAILIIGIGMVVYTRAASTLTGTDMSEHQIAAYNSDFEAYEGGNVSGSDVRALVNKIVAHNRNNSNDASLIIQISEDGSTNNKTATIYSGTGVPTGTQYQTSHYKAANSYKVTMRYEPKSNYITEIDIKDN